MFCARTVVHLDGIKYSGLRTGIYFTEPSRPTAPARFSMCVNDLFHFCTVAVHTILCSHYTMFTLYRVHSIPCSQYTVFTPYRVHTIQCSHYTVFILYRVHSIPCSHYTVFTPYRVHTIQCSHYTVFILYRVHTIPYSHYMYLSWVMKPFLWGVTWYAVLLLH